MYGRNGCNTNCECTHNTWKKTRALEALHQRTNVVKRAPVAAQRNRATTADIACDDLERLHQITCRKFVPVELCAPHTHTHEHIYLRIEHGKQFESLSLTHTHTNLYSLMRAYLGIANIRAHHVGYHIE